MYIISAVICFLAVGTHNIDLCFKSEVPIKFKNIENQVKMKLDLQNLIADVKELQRDMKMMNKKDKEIVKQNKSIERQHKQLFSLIEGNTNNNSSGYSYGD